MTPGMVMAAILMVAFGVETLFGPPGITSTFWFVLTESCALYLLWRWTYVRR